MHGVGRVVGGDGVDHAVEDGLDHGVAVGGRAQRRVHLGVGVVEADVLVGEQEVVRRHLAGDAQAVAAGLAHGGQRRGGRGVGHVQVDAGVAQLGDQADVALDDGGFGLGWHAAQTQAGRRPGRAFMLAPLREARVLGVLDDGEAHARGGGQRLAHDVVLEDGPAVVGDGHGSGGFEGGVVVESLRLWNRAWRRRWERREPDAPRSGACIQRVISGESLTGVVLGMAATEVNPPAAAAAVPLAMVSL